MHVSLLVSISIYQIEYINNLDTLRHHQSIQYAHYAIQLQYIYSDCLIITNKTEQHQHMQTDNHNTQQTMQDNNKYNNQYQHQQQEPLHEHHHLPEDQQHAQHNIAQEPTVGAFTDANAAHLTIQQAPKRVSYATEHSIITVGSCSRKKYYLKKNRFTQDMLNSQLAALGAHTHSNQYVHTIDADGGQNQSSLVYTNSYKKHGSSGNNIFDLTSGYSHTYSQVGDANTQSRNDSRSKQYRNSLFSSQVNHNDLSHAQVNSNYSTLPNQYNIINPQSKYLLPVITQSKYNFKSSVVLEKVKKKLCHKADPQYVRNAAEVDSKNIGKMRKYKQLWANKSMERSDLSVIDRSLDKAEKYIQKHNSQIYHRKAAIQFQNILRDRHIKESNRIGNYKAVPNRSLPGLKGKGGSVRSLFQEMYAVQQVYKIHK